MNTAKHEAPPSALSVAIEGIIRRSDEISAACEGERGELAAFNQMRDLIIGSDRLEIPINLVVG